MTWRLYSIPQNLSSPNFISQYHMAGLGFDPVHLRQRQPNSGHRALCGRPFAAIIRKSLRFRHENEGFCGASDLTRTGDLLITSEMHYRLCYTSILSMPYDYTGKWEKSQSFFMNANPVPGVFLGWRADRRRFRGACRGHEGGRRGDRWR